jgi:RNA polymerase sigma factor (TIGR02999 family)
MRRRIRRAVDLPRLLGLIRNFGGKHASRIAPARSLDVNDGTAPEHDLAGGPAAARDVTRLLHAWSGGDNAAAERLTELVYAQVRAIASKHLRQFGNQLTLEPTELAHELFLRLIGGETNWQDRRHFYGVVSVAMRRILVDTARARHSDKRGGGELHVTLSAADQAGNEDSDALALDEALEALRHVDGRKCEIIEMNYLLGLKREEIAEVLDISVPTIDRELRFARAWLRQRLAA